MQCYSIDPSSLFVHKSSLKTRDGSYRSSSFDLWCHIFWSILLLSQSFMDEFCFASLWSLSEATQQFDLYSTCSESKEENTTNRQIFGPQDIMKGFRNWETSIFSDCTPSCKKHLITITICSHTFYKNAMTHLSTCSMRTLIRFLAWLSSIMAIQWKVSCQGLVKVNRSTDGWCFAHGRTTMAPGVANASFHACVPYHSRHFELQFRGNAFGFFKLKRTLRMLDALEFLMMDALATLMTFCRCFLYWNDMKPVKN